MTYSPSQKILENYAKILIRFALGSGVGVKKGDVVRLTASESAKPLYMELRKEILKAGAHIISNYLPDSDKKYSPSKLFYEYAADHQLDFLPKKYLKGLVDEIDHSIMVLSTVDPKELQGVNPAKIIRASKAAKPYKEWLNEKENQGNYTWTLALYGTEEMAKEAGMSLKEYWDQIIKACFLDLPNPVKKWKEVYRDIKKYQDRLNALSIEKVHIEGPDADLWIKIGSNRQWLGGSGRNIPSFELFVSPDWRGTEGWICFNQPLYYQGNLIRDITLEFKKGIIVKAFAKKNNKFLQQLVAAPNANRIGEFSLTDSRFSRITRFMAETLFDENVGGENGNTHIAIGSAYKESLRGDISKISKKEWQKLGFNDSVIHTDIISTTPRTVTAYLTNGSTKIIYKDGKYTV